MNANENTAEKSSDQRKIFLDALNGHKTDRIPFWFMRQAGRYLPEYRELRTQKGSFLDLVFDPQTASEITIQPIRRFNMDAAILFSDILVIPHALGQTVSFVEGEGPKLKEFNLGKLNFNELETTLSPIYETATNTRQKLDSEGFSHISLIGFAGAPWTVATYMIEGGTSRDFLKTKKMAYGDPQNFASLISTLVEATAHYLVKQIEAGAEALQLFDSWAGALDSDEFQKWVIEPTRQIVDLVKASHPYTPVIGFPKGAGPNYQDYAQNTGVNALSLDSQIPAHWAARTLQPLMPVQGNLDPVALLTGGDAMKQAARRIIKDLSGGPFIFNLGHGIHKDTPVKHVEELVKIIRNN